eukprot:TRINITY_DN11759_c0_g1_i1.p1 TRINITY_DN11759_c0_g1~~TRINITY_DN11759_c0_g1_i1.p1  ORF type:complete len:464 (-),score=38.43 TRINITY_DN11759_c0_g1_i1:255-1646(-)
MDGYPLCAPTTTTPTSRTPHARQRQRVVALGVVWWVLLVCCLPGQSAATLTHDHCTMSNHSPTYFLAVPTTLPLAECAEYANASCCSVPYSNLIREHADLVQRYINEHILATSMSDSCLAITRTLACFPCATAQHLFAQAWGTDARGGVDLQMCHSFCQSFFDACSQATLIAVVSNNEDSTPKTIEAEYGYAERFCRNFFSDKISVQTREHDCFGASVPSCDVEDFDMHYTPCDKNTNTRTLVFIKKSTAICEGQVPPKSGLRCGLTCESGQYLPWAETECQPCPAGSFAINGEHVAFWQNGSLQFSGYDGRGRGSRGGGPVDDALLPLETHCSSKLNSGATDQVQGECTGWKVDPSSGFLYSGETSDSQSSHLTLSTTLVLPGYILFMYKVDSDAPDGLRFLVDGTEAMALQTEIEEFQQFQYNLSSGVHILQWVYDKDSSLSEGADLAIIKVGLSTANRPS